jgi:hypothetical protein
VDVRPMRVEQERGGGNQAAIMLPRTRGFVGQTTEATTYQTPPSTPAIPIASNSSSQNT